MDIKNTLVSIRESKGYSKRTVSEMTGIPYTTYIKYESGERKDVSMDALVKIANLYNVTTDYLLGREPAASPLDTLATMISVSKKEKQMLSNYFNMPKEDRLKVIQLLSKITSTD